MEKKQLNVGVIGVGEMGHCHAEVWSQLPGASLVALSDINEQTVKEVAQRCGTKDWYTDYHELLERQDIDAVSIATPDVLHKDVAIAAAKAKKHVLLEKPIAHSVSDAIEIIRAAEENGIKLMIGHLLRFSPAYYSVKSALKEGSLDKPIYIYCRRNATVFEAEQAKGTVSVAERLSIHDIDIANWYLEDEVESVFAQTSNGKIFEKYGVSDFMCILLKYRNGTLVTIESGWGITRKFANWKNPPSWHGWGDTKMEVVSTNGVVYIDMLPMSVMACDDEGWKFPDMFHVPELNGQTAGDFRNELMGFMDCVLNDKKIPITGEEALKALRIAVAADESAAKGQPIQMI